MKRRKLGQIFSADFLVGVIVVLFVMTTLQVYNSRILEDIKEEQRMVFHESLASRTDTLLLFEGYPEDWNSTNVEVLGFSTGTPNELDVTKLAEYFEMDNDTAEELLGFYDRDYYLSLEDGDGNVLDSNGTVFERGKKSWEDTRNVYTVEREVSIDEIQGKASMRLVVW
ncbi:MAG: hypothetical protein ACLFTY_01955 [Candidatus Aenigmatarchaeota archaeon]